MHIEETKEAFKGLIVIITHFSRGNYMSLLVVFAIFEIFHAQKLVLISPIGVKYNGSL